MLREQAAPIAALSGLDTARLQYWKLSCQAEGSIALVVAGVEIYLPLTGMVDTGEERQRLEKDLAETQSQIERLEKLLASSFAEKAPAAVVQKERDKLAGFQATAEKIRSQLSTLEQ